MDKLEWADKLKLFLHMSSLINIEELRAYRKTVGQNTENIIRKLSNGEMKRKVYKENLQRILIIIIY
ncbi:hypothetical protein [Parabacteroides distasonis]|uniref:hypothetical protein n=1 Tax=Parabacteroides distasonis TaxID=823 RepID=UPI0028045D03|nr:hypothetical protein [Parabacteroides distasonis]WMI43227.1 hypothetical protein Q8809_02540 [Parabacteroides distasonis]